jgi:hypothetical protein
MYQGLLRQFQFGNGNKAAILNDINLKLRQLKKRLSFHFILGLLKINPIIN